MCAKQEVKGGSPEAGSRNGGPTRIRTWNQQIMSLLL